MNETPRPESLTPPDPLLPPLEQLRIITAQLRGPGGCPWDREQTHSTLRGGLLEEAYEVAAAIDAADDANLREELGDLLLQVVFHSQIATEEGRFNFDDCARDIAEKLVRRHPHVYAAESAEDSTAVLKRWEEIKRQEKGGEIPESILSGVPTNLPALMYAEKVQKKAAKVGFDWSEIAPVIEKIREELAEVEHAISMKDPMEIENEVGDLLFATVNLARKLKVESEVALRRATEKFITRFKQIEGLAKERGLVMDQMSLTELDTLWDEVKRFPQS